MPVTLPLNSIFAQPLILTARDTRFVCTLLHTLTPSLLYNLYETNYEYEQRSLSLQFIIFVYLTI